MSDTVCGFTHTPTPGLFARIKKSSKYAYQAPAEQWFAVDAMRNDSYPVCGNSNNYRISDVVFGVKVGDRMVKLS